MISFLNNFLLVNITLLLLFFNFQYALAGCNTNGYKSWNVDQYSLCLAENICQAYKNNINFGTMTTFFNFGDVLTGSCSTDITSKNHFNQMWVTQVDALGCLANNCPYCDGYEGGVGFCYSSNRTDCSTNLIQDLDICSLKTDYIFQQCTADNIMYASLALYMFTLQQSLINNVFNFEQCLCARGNCYNTRVRSTGDSLDIINAFISLSDVNHNRENFCQIIYSTPTVGIELYRRDSGC